MDSFRRSHSKFNFLKGSVNEIEREKGNDSVLAIDVETALPPSCQPHLTSLAEVAEEWPPVLRQSLVRLAQDGHELGLLLVRRLRAVLDVAVALRLHLAPLLLPVALVAELRLRRYRYREISCVRLVGESKSA